MSQYILTIYFDFIFKYIKNPKEANTPKIFFFLWKVHISKETQQQRTVCLWGKAPKGGFQGWILTSLTSWVKIVLKMYYIPWSNGKKRQLPSYLGNARLTWPRATHTIPHGLAVQTYPYPILGNWGNLVPLHKDQPSQEIRESSRLLIIFLWEVLRVVNGFTLAGPPFSPTLNTWVNSADPFTLNYWVWRFCGKTVMLEVSLGFTSGLR